MSAALDFNAVIHDLGEVIVSAENVLVNPGRGQSSFVTLGAKQGVNFAGCASGGCNDSLGVLRENLAVHAWFVIDAVEVRLR